MLVRGDCRIVSTSWILEVLGLNCPRCMAEVSAGRRLEFGGHARGAGPSLECCKPVSPVALPSMTGMRRRKLLPAQSVWHSQFGLWPCQTDPEGKQVKLEGFACSSAANVSPLGKASPARLWHGSVY